MSGTTLYAIIHRRILAHLALLAELLCQARSLRGQSRLRCEAPHVRQGVRQLPIAFTALSLQWMSYTRGAQGKRQQRRGRSSITNCSRRGRPLVA